MANLQNYKRVKIRMDDMISQQFFRLQNICYVYSIGTFTMTIFLQISMMISANSAHCDKGRSAFTNKCNSRAISDSAFFIIEITIIQSAFIFFHLLDLLLRLGLLQKYKKAPIAGVIS